MKTALRRVGNSSGVILPKALLDEIGATPGDALDLSVENGRLVIAPAHAPRAGWAEASRAIAEAGEDILAWPEFSNAADDALTW